MRPESRINRILGKLSSVWHQPDHIDLRLGQLLRHLDGSGANDLFTVEDTAWERSLEAAIDDFEGVPVEFIVTRVTHSTSRLAPVLSDLEDDDEQEIDTYRITSAGIDAVNGEGYIEADDPDGLSDPDDIVDPVEQARLGRIMDWWRAGKDVPPVRFCNHPGPTTENSKIPVIRECAAAPDEIEGRSWEETAELNVAKERAERVEATIARWEELVRVTPGRVFPVQDAIDELRSVYRVPRLEVCRDESLRNPEVGMP